MAIHFVSPIIPLLILRPGSIHWSSCVIIIFTLTIVLPSTSSKEVPQATDNDTNDTYDNDDDDNGR